MNSVCNMLLLQCCCVCVLPCAAGRPQNEADIAAALRDAGIPRSSVFITSKVSPYQQGTAKATAACADILQRLDTHYVDLLLIHWPGVARLDAQSPDNATLRLETWRVRCCVVRGVVPLAPATVARACRQSLSVQGSSAGTNSRGCCC